MPLTLCALVLGGVQTVVADPVGAAARAPDRPALPGEHAVVPAPILDGGPPLPGPAREPAAIRRLAPSAGKGEEEDGARPASSAHSGHAGMISGRVQGSFGRPLPGTRVRLLRGSEERVATVDDTGEYAFEHLPPGHYRLWLDHRSLPGDHLPPAPGGGRAHGTARLAAGARTLVDLSASLAAVVCGRVVDEDGVGVADALVQLVPATGEEAATRTDPWGFFELGGLRPGEYTVRPPLAVASEPTPLRLRLEAGERHELCLRRGASEPRSAAESALGAHRIR